MSEENPIVEKIRKLLRLADNARGATQAEAERAMEAAQRLMTQHGIDQVMLMSKEEEELGAQRVEVVKQYHHTGRQRYETDQYIARILRTCFGVRILWSQEWVVVKSKVLKNWEGAPREVLKQRLVYVIVGDKTDVEVAIMMIAELNPIMRRLLNAHLRETGQVWNAITCHSYFEGLCQGYCDANERGKAAALADTEENTRNRYALVLVDKEKAVEQFYSNISTVRGRTMSGGRSGGYHRDEQAFAKGKAVGSKLNLGAKRLTK